MDQHLSEAWLALKEDDEASSPSETEAEHLPAGRAWFTLDDDEENQAMLLACERRELLEPLLQHVDLNLRARCITVMIEDVAVPVVIVLLKIQGTDHRALFSAWANELSPRTGGILKNLATQPHLPIALIDEKGRTVGISSARNVLAPRMESMRGWISNLARSSPWTRHQFAAAKAYIRSMYPTSEELWARFDEDSASAADDQEPEALPA
jgi:hypothetical protein